MLGFMACFGILSGKVDIGMNDVPLTEVFDAIHKDIVVYHDKRARMLEAEQGVRATINGWKQ